MSMGAQAANLWKNWSEWVAFADLQQGHSHSAVNRLVSKQQSCSSECKGKKSHWWHLTMN
jgi:hypothetical protein